MGRLACGFGVGGLAVGGLVGWGSLAGSLFGGVIGLLVEGWLANWLLVFVVGRWGFGQEGRERTGEGRHNLTSVVGLLVGWWLVGPRQVFW